MAKTKTSAGARSKRSASEKPTTRSSGVVKETAKRSSVKGTAKKKSGSAVRSSKSSTVGRAQQVRSSSRSASGSRSRSQKAVPQKAKPGRSQTSRSKTASSSGDRFEARRHDAARQSSRRRLRIVAGLSVVSCLAVGTVALINSSALDVNEVVVVGADKADPAAIVDASKIVPGQSLLEVDSEDSAQLVERVSWVGTAEVRRSLNGQVEIAVAEREPLIALPAKSRFALIDHWGRQLEIVDQRPEGYLRVSGVEASGEAGQLAPPETALVLTFVSSASVLVTDQVDSIRVVDGEVIAQLRSGGSVNFGDEELIGEKIRALETLLNRVDLGCLAEIDLRVPSAPALKRLPASSSGAEGSNAESAAESTSPADQVTTEGGTGEDPKLTPADC